MAGNSQNTEIEIRREQRIGKVPEVLKDEKNSEGYIPKVVSFGPYHHGKQELGLAEKVKPITLAKVVPGGYQDFCRQEIKKNINNIRNCYEKECSDEYSDDNLVEMMLRDGSFIMSMLLLVDGEGAASMVETLGAMMMPIALRDMFLVENQIPFCILKLLLKSRYNEDQIDDLINRYFSMCLYEESPTKRSSPPKKEEDPRHLLEAFYRRLFSDLVRKPRKYRGFSCYCFRRAVPNTDLESVNVLNVQKINDNGSNILIRKQNVPKSKEGIVEGLKLQFSQKKLKADRACKDCRRLIKSNVNEGDRDKKNYRKFLHSFRSVTGLKAKGIRFKPSSTKSLKDVLFESNCIFGKLQLPIWCVTIYTDVFFVNMIAYELIPDTDCDYVVATYINLMKSLIVRPEDVKELREKKILFSLLGSDEQILKMYQDINTSGIDNPSIFQDVEDRIQEHYNSRSKTWIGELNQTYFRTPWTIIALFVATCLLVLSVIQTVYTVKC